LLGNGCEVYVDGVERYLDAFLDCVFEEQKSDIKKGSCEDVAQ
jgi:hypothetical protein